MINDYLKRNISYDRKYLYCDAKPKFIYKSLKQNNIIGMNYILFNKVIDLNRTSNVNGIKFAHINYDNTIHGWVKYENLIRIYRVRGVNGKVNISGEYSFNGTDYSFEIEKLKNKIVKVFYLFEYHDEWFYLVSKLGESNLIPIHSKYFNKLTTPTETLVVNVKQGISFYNSSSFENKIGEFTEAGEYKVSSFYEGTKNVKIHYQKGKVWIENECVLSLNHSNMDINELDLMDMIIAIDEERKAVKRENKSLTNVLEEIKENIIVDSEGDSIYVERLLGDVYDQ